MIQRFKEKSAIRVHCSPPSNAAIHAAEHALVLNERYGDSLRLHLLKLVRYFRSLMKKAGFRIKNGVFPVQTIKTSKSDDAVRLHDRLLDLGINTVLRCERDSRQVYVSFIITIAHKPGDIKFLVNAISETKFEHSYASQIHA